MDNLWIVGRHRRVARHRPAVLAEQLEESVVVDRPVLGHDAELAGQVLDVVAAELRLLAHELFADDLCGIDRRRLLVILAPTVRRLAFGLLCGGRVARRQDPRGSERGLQDVEIGVVHEVHDRERLHRRDRDDVGALGGFVTARRREELDLQVAAPRLEEPHLRQYQVVDRVLIRAGRVVGAVLRRHRIALQLLGVGEDRHDGDPLPRHALCRGAAIVRAGLPRLHTHRAAAELRAVEAAVGTVFRIVMTAAGIGECSLGSDARGRYRYSRALRARDRRGARALDDDRWDSRAPRPPRLHPASTPPCEHASEQCPSSSPDLRIAILCPRRADPLRSRRVLRRRCPSRSGAGLDRSPWQLAPRSARSVAASLN